MICNAYTSPLRTVRAFKFRHLCWGKPSAYWMACTRLVIVSWNRLNLYRRLQKTLCKSRKSTLSLMRYFDGPTLTRLTSYKHRLFPLPLTQQSAVTLLDKQQNFQWQRSPPHHHPGGGTGVVTVYARQVWTPVYMHLGGLLFIRWFILTGVNSRPYLSTRISQLLYLGMY